MKTLPKISSLPKARVEAGPENPPKNDARLLIKHRPRGEKRRAAVGERVGQKTHREFAP